MLIFRQVAGKGSYQTAGVCNISKTNSNLGNCAFCGKLYADQYLSRKRKDPQDHKKYQRICDRCNQAYLDRQLLTPFVSQSTKLRRIVDQREGDYTVLSNVLEEVNRQVSSQRQVGTASART